jgi:DNA-binding GntR family transcriptional regulator
MERKTGRTDVKPPHRIANGHAASASLDDEVYCRIYNAIAGQRLPPGTRLREDQMREVFGVSRARIRKVFSRLAFEGLVSIEPNRGASVAKPSPEEARQNFAARRAIETAVVGMAAKTFEARQRATLARHVAKEAAAESRRDIAEMIHLSGEFHMLLAEIAGNRVLAKFLRELITRESLAILAYEKPGQPSCSNHEHQTILGALAKCDAPKAVKLMLQHLESVERRLDLDRDAGRTVDLKQAFASQR